MDWIRIRSVYVVAVDVPGKANLGKSVAAVECSALSALPCTFATRVQQCVALKIWSRKFLVQLAKRKAKGPGIENRFLDGMAGEGSSEKGRRGESGKC